MKKIFNAPALKVIGVENDIIATSSPQFSSKKVDAGSALKGGMMDFDFDDEEF